MRTNAKITFPSHPHRRIYSYCEVCDVGDVNGFVVQDELGPFYFSSKFVKERMGSRARSSRRSDFFFKISFAWYLCAVSALVNSSTQ